MTKQTAVGQLVEELNAALAKAYDLSGRILAEEQRGDDLQLDIGGREQLEVMRREIDGAFDTADWLDQITR